MANESATPSQMWIDADLWNAPHHPNHSRCRSERHLARSAFSDFALMALLVNKDALDGLRIGSRSAFRCLYPVFDGSHASHQVGGVVSVRYQPQSREGGPRFASRASALLRGKRR